MDKLQMLLDKIEANLNPSLPVAASYVDKKPDGINFDKRYVDIKFLSTYLNCKVPTIRSWIQLKSIPYSKLGKLVRFDLSRIDVWLKEKNVQIN